MVDRYSHFLQPIVDIPEDKKVFIKKSCLKEECNRFNSMNNKYQLYEVTINRGWFMIRSGLVRVKSTNYWVNPEQDPKETRTKPEQGHDKGWQNREFRDVSVTERFTLPEPRSVGSPVLINLPGKPFAHDTLRT